MSFSISLSGINAASANLNATANNIANVNTTGFKESRAEFADVFSSSGYGLSATSSGSGVSVSTVSQQFTQGDISDTGRSLDLAVSGEGFFTLTMNGTKVYSRAGNFQTDANGYVMNPQGARLQVYQPNADGTGFDVGQLTDLRLLTTDSAPLPTTKLELAVTLPANAAVPTVTPFDPADSNTYAASSGGLSVYDSLGVGHTQSSYFVKTANPNEWQVYNYIDGVAAGAPTTLQFSSSGALLSPTGDITLDPHTPTTGAAPMQMTLSLAGSTQYGEKFSLRNTTQDGYASGKLSDINFSEDGVVYARYSNGVSSALGQVALTRFNNNQGLKNLGDNLFGESYTSGSPRTGAPTTSDFGQIQSGALESSTVDLTEQLVNMITAQRNFQANAQMLSTQNDITQAIINIR